MPVRQFFNILAHKMLIQISPRREYPATMNSRSLQFARCQAEPRQKVEYR